MRGAFFDFGTATSDTVPTTPLVSDATGLATPTTLWALTVDRTTWSTSAEVRTYVAAVAPEIAVQPVQLALQRCHW